MIKLYDKSTGQYLGSIDDQDLQFLIDNLEEENLEDTDYYINRIMFDALKEKGMNQGLTNLIEAALGQADGIEIRYERV